MGIFSNSFLGGLEGVWRQNDGFYIDGRWSRPGMDTKKVL